MDQEFFEQARRFLPAYLSPSDQAELYSELRDFPDTRSYYAGPDVDPAPVMQGDGWEGFVAIRFATGNRKRVSGMIISNTCDIDPDNPRTLPPNILFSPLIRLEDYGQRLLDAGRGETAVGDTLETIRRQEKNNIFFLPAGQYGPPESMAILDDIHVHPRDAFLDGDSSRLFRLSQTGFYILLIKLSIHFCRMNESVSRSA